MSMYSNEMPVLNEVEVRVLGALIEKSKTTPDYYPMTLNALMAACNQKTSRFPVVDYDEETIATALSNLKAQSLVATAIGGGSRVLKYKHNMNTVFDFSPEEVSILCLLMLRGPQTPGELNTHSARLHEFKSIEQVLSVLEKLISFNPSMALELPKQAGQKERRFAHLFCGIPTYEAQSHETTSTKTASAIEMRVQALEQELETVKATLAKLVQDLS
jgi:uncharacterized protein YceH (UPF0502 family)